MTQTRQQSDIDRLADAHLDAMVALSPTEATMLGVAGRHDTWDDFSVEGLHAQRDLVGRTLEGLERLRPVDDVDRVTAAALRERLGLEQESLDLVLTGRIPVDLNVIASAPQTVRDVFDVMGKATAEHWHDIVSRLEAVPAALQQFTSSLTWSAERGQVAPRRQVLAVAEQCRDQAADGTSTFEALIGEAQDQPHEVRSRLAPAVASAKIAFGALAYFLEGLAARAPESDACGRELYLSLIHI